METLMYSKMQICGLLNVLLLAMFYYRTPQLPLYKRQLFSALLRIFFVDIVLDIGSVAAICNRDVLPPALVELVCRGYLVSLVTGIWMAVVYVSSDLFPEQKHRRIAMGLGAVTLVELAGILLRPIYIFHEQGMLYTYGGSVETVYVAASINITLIILCTLSKKIEKRRRFGVCAWMFFWLTAMTLQNFNNELLLVGFAASLGMIVLFISLENPELCIDPQYGCFNNMALHEYLSQCLERGEPFVVCNIALDQANLVRGKEIGAELLKQAVMKILSHHKKLMVFNNLDLNIYAVAPDLGVLQAGMAEYRQVFGAMVGGKVESRFYVLPDGRAVKSFDDYALLFNHMKNYKPVTDESGVVIVTPEDVTEFYHRDVMRREISRALEEDWVEVFLQPIYNLRKKRFSSAEALVRIRRPDGTLLPPGQFISVAEETGQIIELGKRVLEKTAEMLAEGRALALGLEYVEVNLSIVQCEDPKLVNEIIELVERYGIRPEWLNLEITETGSIHAQKLILQNMQQLQDYGITFSLDDFGKGESNMMYVVDMPFQLLKLDMDMTKAYHNNPKAQSVMEAVVQMAHGMGMKMVAEGIETAEELRSMEALGIDYIQGYYFSRPLPVEEYLAFLQGQAADNLF